MSREIIKNVLSLFVAVFCTQINHAQTVTIGNQVWMTSNLDVDRFRNGDPIPQAKTAAEWRAASDNKQPAWCYYNNDPANGGIYGKLYNWYAVNDPRGLAPAGYHIPSSAELEQLKDFLGTGVLSSGAGAKMKSSKGWNSHTTGGSKTCPNCKNWNAEYRKKVPCHTCKDTRSVPAPTETHSGNGTNSSGFSGLPGGNRNSIHGSFNDVGTTGTWWSSTADSDYRTHARNYTLVNDHDNLLLMVDAKGEGLSVRCLRD